MEISRESFNDFSEESYDSEGDVPEIDMTLCKNQQAA